jgi:hypothetical protein
MADYLSSVDRFHARMTRSYPWRQISTEEANAFYWWLGKRLKKGMDTDFSEYELGRRHALNCEKNAQDLEKLEMSWEVYQAELKTREAAARAAAPEALLPLAGKSVPHPDAQSQNAHLLRLRAAWRLGGRHRDRAIASAEANPEWGIVITEEGPIVAP